MPFHVNLQKMNGRPTSEETTFFILVKCQQKWHQATFSAPRLDVLNLPAMRLCAPSHGLDGIDDGQEAVQGHEDQRVNAHVRRRNDQKLDELAPGNKEKNAIRSV